jgi:hypothetical protein
MAPTNFSSPPSRLQKSSFKSSSRGHKYLARLYWRPLVRRRKVRPNCDPVISPFAVTWALFFYSLSHRCKTPTARRDWIGCRGGRKCHDGFCDRQANAGASDDTRRSASHSKHETGGWHGADPTGARFHFVCFTDLLLTGGTPGSSCFRSEL